MGRQGLRVRHQVRNQCPRRSGQGLVPVRARRLRHREPPGRRGGERRPLDLRAHRHLDPRRHGVVRRRRRANRHPAQPQLPHLDRLQPVHHLARHRRRVAQGQGRPRAPDHLHQHHPRRSVGGGPGRKTRLGSPPRTPRNLAGRSTRPRRRADGRHRHPGRPLRRPRLGIRRRRRGLAGPPLHPHRRPG
ncbi:hypothetical protein D3C78_1404840 [compost metagenome]